MLCETAPHVSVEELHDTGSVLEVGDGVALVSGLRDIGSQELVEFSGGVYGIAFSLLDENVGCILLGPEEGIREGSDATRTGHLLKVPVGDSLLGRIVDAVGEPIDGRGHVAPKAYMPVERKAPGVVERQPVDTPLHTGIKVLDALVPLGRGQRELIIGDRKIGKTTVAVDTILAQKGEDVVCVYCAIGQKASSVARVVQTLEDRGAMEYTTIVVALPSAQPAFRYVAPYAACAIGEYFMEQGRDALVIYDDLSKHAVTYREMSALLGRPIGREAYPGDIFYVHSRLLERAARMSDARGGGSLTGLPIVETLASDISAFIPTNVISICDGQIVLDAQLFNEGIRPSMEVGLSVSRVGGNAQTKAVKQVAGRLRIDLAQYQEMAQFVKFGAEVDSATLQQLARGERARELLIQDQHVPMSTVHEVVVLFAVVNGFLDQVPVECLRELESALTEYMDVQHPILVEEITKTGEISTALDGELRNAISDFMFRWCEERATTASVEAERRAAPGGVTGALAEPPGGSEATEPFDASGPPSNVAEPEAQPTDSAV
ncbi:MAG: F0F1 ATP synthase subunit alpha [Coriobacteriia bacterium]|nr:F0F1 ATP synthase subunit alpha [Coriobacteriia bacterium]